MSACTKLVPIFKSYSQNVKFVHVLKFFKVCELFRRLCSLWTTVPQMALVKTTLAFLQKRSHIFMLLHISAKIQETTFPNLYVCLTM